MNPKISVIIPVYNTEKYLKECIDSVLKQTLLDFELILIDDGSEDNSGDICDAYALQDTRIKVIHQENGGVSQARYAGIKCAKTDFIIFVDSDDTVKERCFQDLWDLLITQEADIAIFKNDRLLANGELQEIQDKESDLNTYVFNGKEALEQSVSSEDNEYLIPTTLWSKIFKKEKILSIGIEDYMEELPNYFFEDFFILPRILLNCEKIACRPEHLYNYRVTPNSIVQGKFKIKNIELFEANKILFKKIKKNLSKNKQEIVSRAYANTLIKAGILIMDSGMPELRPQAEDVRNEFSKHFEEFMKCKNKNVDIKFKISFLIFRISPKLWRLFFGKWFYLNYNGFIKL